MERLRTRKTETVSGSKTSGKELTLKVFGLGGAGCNAVEHIAQASLPARSLSR